MTTTETTPQSDLEQAHTDRSRWVALYVLCAGMLMIVLDVTVVNVALPVHGAQPLEQRLAVGTAEVLRRLDPEPAELRRDLRPHVGHLGQFHPRNLKGLDPFSLNESDAIDEFSRRSAS